MPLSTINSNSIANGTVVAADILDGTISSSKLVSANIAGDRLAANTLSNTVFQTGSVENYLNASGLGFGMRNRIINGAMVIDQRNAGASATPANNDYTLDRWQTSVSQSAKLTIQQNAGSVTPPTGFSNYLGITSSSAYSIGASDYFMIQHKIEGFNTFDLAWGTANASAVTLSFWVRSSLTGTFGGVATNSATNRSYPFTYTISSANTWEQKSVTIAGDTSGTWIGATNGIGIMLRFGLGVGSTYSGTAGSWSGNTYFSATGATSVVGTNGATFYITGVQLEKGSTATSFDYRPYSAELAMCQRYFYLSNPTNTAKNGGAWGSMHSTTTGHITGPLPVPMRTSGTVTFGGTSNNYYVSNVSATSGGTPVNTSATALIVDFEISSMNTGAIGYPIQYNGQMSISAEL